MSTPASPTARAASIEPEAPAIPPHLRITSDGKRFIVESRWEDGSWHRLLFGGPFDTKKEALACIARQVRWERESAGEKAQAPNFKPID